MSDNINVEVKRKNPSIPPKNLRELTAQVAEIEQDITNIKQSSGTFENKPNGENIYIGFSYFCTDKQTTEGYTNGIMIFYKGQDTTDPDNPTDVWVDALGRIVS